MSSSQTSCQTAMASSQLEEETESDGLRREYGALKDRLKKLSEATLRNSENLDFGVVLQEIVDNSRSLTGARYGALLTYDETGAIQDFTTSGLSAKELELLKTSTKGLGLLGSLNQVSKPLRISDIASHPSSVGFPENHPTMKPFLGIPVWYHGEHVGNIYLTEKERAQEFTEEDEEILVMFASQAASIISNARRYEEEHQAKVYLETLLDLSPMGVVVFNTQTGDLDFLNQEVRRMMGDLGIPEEGLDDIFEVLSFRRTDGREISYMDLPAMRVLLSAETVRAEEIVVQAPSGKEITAVINAAPIFSESGEIVSVVSVLQDMTPLDNSERKRAEFLGVVSEELRTPLTTIKGSAAALRSIVESMNPTEPLQLLRIIDQQADLMRSQVNSLIEVSQIETGTLSVVAELADVSELLKEACGEFIRDHGASAIEPDIPAGLPNVMVDKQRIG